jgi:hypothetical protein
MQIAKRVYSLAQEQNDAALMVGPTALWQPRRIFWAISRPRDNTRSVVSRSGARRAYCLRSKRSMITGKKRGGQEDMDSDYLFANFLQGHAFRSRPPAKSFAILRRVAR